MSGMWPDLQVLEVQAQQALQWAPRVPGCYCERLSPQKLQAKEPSAKCTMKE